MFLDHENQDSFSDEIMKDNNNNDDDFNDDKIELMINTLIKKNKEIIF